MIFDRNHKKVFIYIFVKFFPIPGWNKKNNFKNNSQIFFILQKNYIVKLVEVDTKILMYN